MRKRFIALVALAIGGAGLVYWTAQNGTLAVAQGNRAPAPTAVRAPQGVPVETARAERAQSRADIHAIGTLQSDESVRIAPEIAGRVAEIAFAEGQQVAAGDVLIRLDDALTRAELADAEAQFALARQNFDRATALARTGTGTARARDEATAAFETGRVSVELARTRLDKHTVRAPFPGIVGLRRVSVGAFLGIGADMVNIEKIDALKVDFKVPEIFLARVATGQRIEVTVDARPGETFTGEIYAIDPMVDVNGRALQIRARLANPDLALRPGLFARITIRGLTEEEVVLVPESAVVPRGGEMFVFRIEGGKAIESKVRLGQRRAGMVEVVEGLPADAVVVAAGHQRLRDGAPVDVVAAAPGAPG